MATKDVLEFTDDNFDADVIQSDLPVLVDFWAAWCQPCLKMAPTIEELARQYHGKVKVGKLDTDANQEVAIRFGITAIPTIMLFQNGEVVKKFVGLTPKRQFETVLNEVAV